VAEEKRARAALPQASRTVVLLIFLLSGIAGLIYEVVWARELVLVFGNTTQAISAILTGFFAGMAVGSVLGGRLADRVRNPLRMYAILELLVVVVVLLTPATFRGLHEVYRGAFGSLEQNTMALALVRFALAIAALGPATVMMGATLPTLSRYLVRDHNMMGHEFGSLYTVNTLGAIIGTLASGLVLIELIGLTETLLVGVCFSGMAGLAALVLSFRTRPAASTAEAPVTAAPVAPASPLETVRTTVEAVAAHTARPRLALMLAFVSGLTSLGYQNLWTRILSSGTGGSSYIFTAILALFLTGITVGAFVYARFLSRTKHPVALLGVAELALAVVVLGGLGFETKFFANMSFNRDLIIVVLPATLVMGVVFPMTSMLATDSDDRVGTSAGMLLGANTLGAIVGTFVVPFFLMPALTSGRSVVLIALINAVMGLILLWEARSLSLPLRRAGGALSGAVAAAAIALIVVPNNLVADPNINVMGRSHGTVLQVAEDNVAAVQAVRMQDAAQTLRLFVGGYSMTGITADTRMMAHLPLMVRPDAKSMCVIAFGMGSSYRSALMDGLRVEAVELVPSVPGMMGDFFPDASAVESNPDGQILIADGRNHVDLTTHSYDLLIVDPPPPMNGSGTAVLFSQEFYQSAKARLNPGGVMMQWEFRGQTIDEMRSHVKTYASVFKHVVLVFGAASSTYGVMMLGSDDPIDITAAGIQSVLSKPGVVNDLSSAPDSPAGVTTPAAWQQQILGNIWLTGSDVDKFAAGGTLITDDRPYTEYDLLRHLFGPKSPTATRENLLLAMPRSTELASH
jgi:spermidine synthase